MPPGPKSRISRARRGMRRSHSSLSFHGYGKCSNCKSNVRSHHLCLSCGYYNNKQFVS